MTGDTANVLLALDAGVGETGWATFAGWTLWDTGVIAPARARDGPASERIARLLRSLDGLRSRYHPDAAALCQPSGMRWEVPALTLLTGELARWSREAGLPLTPYPTEQVRRAVAGHPRASRRALAFAVMDGLGLLGVRKTTHEWEAIAVGAYHLCQTQPMPDQPGR